MRVLFLLAVLLMGLHKLECWWTAEWLESPYFNHLVSENLPMGEVIFRTFVFWLFVGLVAFAVALQGSGWPTLVLGVWGLTFVLEYHHLIRTLLKGGYYPGLYTALVYLPFGFVYWRELFRHLPGSERPVREG